MWVLISTPTHPSPSLSVCLSLSVSKMKVVTVKDRYTETVLVVKEMEILPSLIYNASREGKLLSSFRVVLGT